MLGADFSVCYPITTKDVNWIKIKAMISVMVVGIRQLQASGSGHSTGMVSQQGWHGVLIRKGRDSRCSDQLTNDKSNFTDYIELRLPKKIIAAN